MPMLMPMPRFTNGQLCIHSMIYISVVLPKFQYSFNNLVISNFNNFIQKSYFPSKTLVAFIKLLYIQETFFHSTLLVSFNNLQLVYGDITGQSRDRMIPASKNQSITCIVSCPADFLNISY